MSTTPTPTLAKIALGAMVTRIREAAGKERAEVAAALGVDTETVRRWENGKIAPKKMAIEAMAKLLGASGAELSRMTTLSLESKRRGMFEGNNVPPDLRVLYETEATAHQIHDLQLEHIPGLLQQPEYHRAVQSAQLPVDDERADQFRRLRTRRQEIVLGRDPLPRMRFIIGRAAMAYLDDIPEVKDDQVKRLREVAALPGVEIRVIAGIHAGMLGSFTILTPPHRSGARPFVYVEGLDGGRYLEGDVVSRYEEAFGSVLTDQSIDLEEYLK